MSCLASCEAPVGVKVRRTQYEYMSSALPSKADAIEVSHAQRQTWDKRSERIRFSAESGHSPIRCY
ncbi:MAG: hypothetical protein JWP25_471 [Bradyrhizobium sp.]|nr:hypothetical protein [Bradyrhizobium sp.]